MSKNEPVIRINLTLHARKTIQSAFFKWAAHAGKLIIIMTELIALSALGYRFFIDRQIIDRNDEIKTEISFIEVQKDREEEFRKTQDRLSYIESIEEKNEIRFQTISKVTDAVSRGVFTTNNFLISEKKIEFEGASLSIFSIYNFIEELKNDPNILAITLDEVTSSSQGIRFVITIELAINENKEDIKEQKQEISVPTS